ncbi:MAG: type II secretion system GspH family protein [Candidatus Marinimicrobia bacterium]|nr:type II secretion system GspH family protein [Candidatus Neomarinimicrobiota bacterium]MCF7923134.1 type II secretion system GspH family protein [Candidatus Neomarinimicrobiota bacterium]
MLSLIRKISEIIKPPTWKPGINQGFTLLEAIITVSIMGILAAVVTPTYLQTQAQAKLVMSQAGASQLQQGFINLYFEGMFIDSLNVWPDEPADHKMTHQWAGSTILYDGRTVAQLYSGSKIIYNPYENPFLYYRLPKTAQEQAGFRIDDPDTGVSTSFRP